MSVRCSRTESWMKIDTPNVLRNFRDCLGGQMYVVSIVLEAVSLCFLHAQAKCNPFSNLWQGWRLDSHSLTIKCKLFSTEDVLNLKGWLSDGNSS